MRGQELTLYERERMELFIRGKWSFRRIGRKLHRNHTVLSREYDRNKDQDGVYRSGNAQRKAEKRKGDPHKRKLDKYDRLLKWTCDRLRDGYSPEQIAGKLKNRPDETWMLGKSLCHETIYQYIYEGEGRFLGLYQYLVRKRKKRRRYARKAGNKAGIAFVTPIRFRQRLRMSESDTMLFRKQRACLSNQYLPRFQILRMHKIPDKSAAETFEAVRKSIASLPYKDIWDGLTFDRGTEGALHWQLRMHYGIDTFHCDPYCSWQKGGVENMNGIVRRYLPLDTDLSELTDADIHDIQEKINNIPRKGLEWRTPNEALAEYLTTHNAPVLIG